MLIAATESSKPHHSRKGSETKNFHREQSAHKKHQRSFSHQVAKFHVRYLQAALKLHRDADISVGLWFAEALGKRTRRDAITESIRSHCFPHLKAAKPLRPLLLYKNNLAEIQH